GTDRDRPGATVVAEGATRGASVCRGQCNAVMAIAACSSGRTSPPRWIADLGGHRVARRARLGAHSPAEAEGDPVSTDLLRPRDHAEEIALFRAEIIGALVR